MPINQIVTPLDSAVLETKEQYEIYFKIVKHAFSQLVSRMESEALCTLPEITYFKQYCDLILYTLDAFQIKYLFDDEEKMKVDLTESGFPNYAEFRYLVNDMELKKEHIAKLPSLETLQSEFLETLLRYKEPVSNKRLHQAASVVYYNAVDEKRLFKRFIQGKVTRNASAEEAEFMVSWSFFDVALNRPFVCFLYFDLHKVRMEDYLSELYTALEQTADRAMTLDTMAYAIDRKLPKLLPKRIKRLDLGPIHSVFAKDELRITHALLEGIIAKTLPLSSYAIALGIDETVSQGSTEEGSLFSSRTLQLWENKRSERYLFTAHRTLQYFYDNIPQHMYQLSRDAIATEALNL